MAQPKSNAVKSKSSDSVLTKLSRNNSKRRSNTAFQTHEIGKKRLKRRMFVKRKPIEVSSTSNDEDSASTQKEQVKAPVRSFLDGKPFLTSALKLLGKSTTSTQYPDNSNRNTKKFKKASKVTRHGKATAKKDTSVANDITSLEKVKRKPHTAVINDNASLEIEKLKPHTTVINDNEKQKQKNKKKHKSKILNNNYEADRIEVLQCKKNIITTPSLADSVLGEEDFDKIKWSDFLPRLVKPDEEEINLEKEKKLNHLVKEVKEGRMEIEKKINEQEEPATLVSEQKDAKFYNFFVDLLETTFSVYNMKTENQADQDSRSVVSSKIAFEIDKAVADKLKVDPKTHQKRFNSNLDDKDWKHVKINKLKGTRTKNYRLDSPEQYPVKHGRNNSKFTLNMYDTAPIPRKPVNKKKEEAKTLRQNLLSVIKEQLMKDSSNWLFEEPTNLFQVLKVMANNKKKSLKTIRFEKSNVKNDYDRIRKRKTSPGIKSKKYYEENKGSSRTPKTWYQKGSGYGSIANTEGSVKSSNHSLVVLSYHDHRKRGRKTENNRSNSADRKKLYKMMQLVM